MRYITYGKTELSCITRYRSETWHSPVAVIMHCNGANAFKADTLLQLTVDSSLHHLFSARQFSKASPDGCQFYAKWKRNSVQPGSNWYLPVMGWIVIWKPQSKVWGLGLISVWRKWQRKIHVSHRYFSKRMTKHPGWFLWSHLFHFNISHTFKGHLGCVKSGH